MQYFDFQFGRLTQIQYFEVATNLFPPRPMFCAESRRSGAVVAAVGEGIYFGFDKTDGPGKLAYGVES